MNTKQFTGILASSVGNGSLSLTVSSGSQFVIGLLGTYAVLHGLDAQAVTSQAQIVIDAVVTAIAAGYTTVHAFLTVWGMVRKFWALFAKTPGQANIIEPIPVQG